MNLDASCADILVSRASVGMRGRIKCYVMEKDSFRSTPSLSVPQMSIRLLPSRLIPSTRFALPVLATAAHPTKPSPQLKTKPPPQSNLQRPFSLSPVMSAARNEATASFKMNHTVCLTLLCRPYNSQVY
jgi:hypothetical protein